MTYRYITRVVTLETGDSANEVWIGLECDVPIDTGENMISAEGMTEDELSIVSRWVTV